METPVPGTPTTARRNLGGIGAVATRQPWYLTRTVVGENVLTVRDRVQWGPIIAGAMVGLIVLLLLTLLGVGIGASAFDPDTDLSDWDTWAGIWGGLSVLVAFFVAGWVASQTAAVEGPYAGMMNGLLAGVTTVVALIVLTAVGLTNLVGFLGSHVNDVSRYVSDVADGDTTLADRKAAFDAVKDGVWGTLVTIVVALASAALAGMLAHHDRRELIEGTG
jgi:hypothetical protein